MEFEPEPFPGRLVAVEVEVALAEEEEEMRVGAGRPGSSCCLFPFTWELAFDFALTGVGGVEEVRIVKSAEGRVMPGWNVIGGIHNTMFDQLAAADGVGKGVGIDN